MSRKAPNALQNSDGRLPRHTAKKPKKKDAARDCQQLMEYLDRPETWPLDSICQAEGRNWPGHLQLGLWRRNIMQLSRAHLPTYVRLLNDELSREDACLIPGKANLNTKKNTKNDIMIQDPCSQKTKLVRMNEFPILFSPQEIVFYQLPYDQFQKVFVFAPEEELRKVFALCLEESECPSPAQPYVLWPSVVLEGLNYKATDIENLLENFLVSQSESKEYFEGLLKLAKEAQLKGGGPEQNEKSQLSAEVGRVHQEIAPKSFHNDADDLDEQQPKMEAENKFCLWLLGTSYFAFRSTKIVSWSSLGSDNAKALFSSPIFSGLLKEANTVIDSLNKYHRMREAEIKADEFKYFIYRLGIYRPEDEIQAYCIPVRFEYIKGVGKRVLIKILREKHTELRWVPGERITVNYNLPLISRKEMSLMYLVGRVPPWRIVTDFYYREFLLLPAKDVHEIFRSFYPQFHKSQQDAYHQRCKACNFVIRNMKFKCCFFCQTFSHEECTMGNSRRAQNLMFDYSPDIDEDFWVCEKCQFCSVCFEAVGEEHLNCSVCESYSHYECGRLKGLDEGELRSCETGKYICEFCLKCKMCSHKLKDNEYLLIGGEFYCSECSEKIKSNNHCHICMKKKEGNSSVKWILCGASQCEKWVHESCDPEYIAVVKSPTASDPYLCPFCRALQVRKVLCQIIDCISVFDEAQFFTEPSYLQIPSYSLIISQPMCFFVMKNKAMEGKYDAEPFQLIQADFQLIISNALKFNMPKDPAHVQAKILRILGQKAFQKFESLFKPQLAEIISGAVFERVSKTKLDLHRLINSQYLEILLNYKAQKSFVEVREAKKKTADMKLEDELKFRSVQILNNFLRNSSLVFHLKKQKIRIVNLFTMPKNQNERGIWHKIKGDLCYYHNNDRIIYTCNECCESYCCMTECLRHHMCTACGMRECKCDSYECGCPPLKEKDRKILEARLVQKYAQPLKSTKQILMELTENYRYCLKCVNQKAVYRVCGRCQGLCSWGYFQCPECAKVWHLSCYPDLLKVTHVTPHSHNKNAQAVLLNSSSTCSIIYCNDCLSANHPNTYQQALNMEAKSKLVKIFKISRYMRIFVEVYFSEGIRLTPYQIQKLILDNYDQFSLREQSFQSYELNYSIIQRFRDFTFRTNAAIERSLAEYVNDDPIVGQTYQNQLQSRVCDSHSFVLSARQLWWKYFRYLSIYDHSECWYPLASPNSVIIPESLVQGRCLRPVSIQEIRQSILMEAYSYTDQNSYHAQVLNQAFNIIELLEPQFVTDATSVDGNRIINEGEFHSPFSSSKEHRLYLESLTYVPCVEDSFYRQQHAYRFSLVYVPRAMPFDYQLNPSFRKKSTLEEAVKEFLLGIYEESKECLRKGSTCLIKYGSANKDNKEYWKVVKRWSRGQRQIQIVLQKRNRVWLLRIDDRPEKVVHEIEQICNQLNQCRLPHKINSFKELGEFLGFTMFEPFYKANHFTNFLQTNLVDEMPLLDKMNKITSLYDSYNWGDNGIFSKAGPAFLGAESANQKMIFYEYSISKNKPFYLTKKPKSNNEKMTKKLEKRLSNIQQSSTGLETVARRQSYITFEDLKRYLIDYSIPPPARSQISLKNSVISNQVFIAPSKIHKLGLFSRKFLKKHTIVIEYIGQIVSESVADLREKKFHYGCYLFSILKEFAQRDNHDKKDIIDATFRGNMARYLNHSCDPNCKARTEYVNNWPRIIIYTTRDIQQFEEITYDYQFNVDAVEKLECTCGAKNCQGRLN